MSRSALGLEDCASSSAAIVSSGLEVRLLCTVGLVRSFSLIYVGVGVGVDAAAGTYAAASRLPAIVLDAILNLPYLLISIRNALLPIAPHVIAPAPPAPPAPAPAPQPQPQPSAAAATSSSEKRAEGVDSEREHEHEPTSSDTGSEADVESNEGYGSGVGEWWVSLKSKAEKPGTDAA